jgi:hypothetical protein
VVPAGWQKKPDGTKAWIVTALAWSRRLPPKDKSKSSKKTTAKPAAPKKAAPARRSR